MMPGSSRLFYLWEIDLSLLVLTVVMTFLTLGYLLLFLRNRTVQYRRQQELEHLITAILLCGDEQERQSVLQEQSGIAMLLEGRGYRRVLARQLVKLSRGLSGSAADSIIWLYEKLDLQKEASERFGSTRWHIKAAAIQELAAMDQRQYLPKVYKATNHSNFHVRMEAQLALVKWTGWEGLRFLNVAYYPITPWQQLSLLQELPVDVSVDLKKMRSWLRSSNETVVELTLKLIQKYQCFELTEEVIQCANSTSSFVRRNALLVLGDSSETGTIKEAV